MRADKPCTTCALHYRGRCAEWDMPAKAARHEATLCGPHGRDHSPPPTPLSWGWLALAAVATLVVVGAALVHHGVLP